MQWRRPKLPSFKELASRSISDKFVFHNYQDAYGKYLMSLRHKAPKLVEIGLGCNMGYGPGKSIEFWQSFFQPPAEIWVFEFDHECLINFLKTKKYPNVKGFSGDQKSESDVGRFLNLSGGDFDVVIDDGSHEFAGQINSLKCLFHRIKSGGIYFIEDLYYNFMKDNSYWRFWQFGSYREQDNNTMKLINGVINALQNPAYIPFERIIGRTPRQLLNFTNLPPESEIKHTLIKSVDCFHRICALIRS